MMEKTKNGVVYNVGESDYKVLRNGYLFRFSSQKHKEKFIENVRIKEEWLCDSLSRRFKVKIDASLAADFQLYIQIETRGFHVEHVETGEVYKCHADVELVLVNETIQNCSKQYQNTMLG